MPRVRLHRCSRRHERSLGIGLEQFGSCRCRECEVANGINGLHRNARSPRPIALSDLPTQALTTAPTASAWALLRLHASACSIISSAIFIIARGPGIGIGGERQG